MPGIAPCAVHDDVLTMAPPRPAASIAASSCFKHAATPRRLVASTASKSANSVSCSGAKPPRTPALFHATPARSAPDHAGFCPGRVERPEPLERSLQQPLHLRFVGDVGRYGQRFAACGL